MGCATGQDEQTAGTSQDRGAACSSSGFLEAGGDAGPTLSNEEGIDGLTPCCLGVGDDGAPEPELPQQLQLTDTWDQRMEEKTAVQRFLQPDEEDLPNDFAVSATDPILCP